LILDAGGHLFAADEDFLYGWAHTYDPYTFVAGEFPYDYMKISSCFDDFNHDPVATIYGVPGDPISDGFETGIGVAPYCWAGNYTWLGNIELLDGVGCFYFETGEICATYYEDGTAGYKIVFLYFPIDYIVTDACNYDVATMDLLATRALTWLDVKTGVADVTTPGRYLLSLNKPNPVANTATISFSVPKATDVSLKVYDATGRVVSTLVNGKVDAGTHTASWDAKDAPAGVYFYRLNSEEFSETRKMVVLH
jgi:hypothetical protein